MIVKAIKAMAATAFWVAVLFLLFWVESKILPKHEPENLDKWYFLPTCFCLLGACIAILVGYIASLTYIFDKPEK